MRHAFTVASILCASACLAPPANAENLTPARCREIADGTFPMLSAFDGLQKVVEGAGTANIAKAAKGRFQQAAEETEQARKQFLSAAVNYRMALAALYNEARNCQNGITLGRTPE